MGRIYISGISGVNYLLRNTLDDIPTNVSGFPAVVFLHNTNGFTVNVTVTGLSKRGAHPKKTCRNIAPAERAVVVFPAPLIGVESIEVERSNGRSPARRFKGSIEEMDLPGVTEIRVSNVTGGPARVRRMDVIDGASGALVLSTIVNRGLQAGESTVLRYKLFLNDKYSVRGHGQRYAMYVNGVLIPMSSAPEKPTEASRRYPMEVPVEKTGQVPRKGSLLRK